MPSRAALDVWAVEHEGLKFNDPTPKSAEFTKPVAPEPEPDPEAIVEPPPGETGETPDPPAVAP